MNALGMALTAYHSGQEDASFTIVRDDGFEQTVPAKVFFDDTKFPALETCALDLCRGQVLDVGAAAGRHSLELHRRGLAVWSLDILPETQPIMSQRGVPHPLVGDISSWAERSFDMVLMLMNGIGMLGTPQRLDEFLRHAHRLVSPGGQLLCDSIDVSMTTAPIHVAHRTRNIEMGLYPGQQRFAARYGVVMGEAFDWLHIDIASLARHCSTNGWNCQLIHQELDGHYLARIFRDT
jgi:SAM-dependent methyltransferase